MYDEADNYIRCRRIFKLKTITKMLPYLLACASAIYVIPFLGVSTGVFMLMPLALLIAAPTACFIASLIYGIKNKFKLLQIIYPILVGILFIPAISIYYNETAWIYSIAYTVIALVGNIIGYAVGKAAGLTG